MQLRLLDWNIQFFALHWLTDEDIIDYELTSRNEPFKGTIVSRKSVAALITDIIDKPEKHIGENIGINQPGTDGDKPFFM